MAQEVKDAPQQTQEQGKATEGRQADGLVQEFLENNKKLVQYIGGAIGAIILLGFFGYSYFTGQNEEAQVELFPAVFYFENDSLELALYGDGSSLGFEDIAGDYGYTKAGNLAKFYAGTSHLKLGNYEEAIDYLNDFSSSDLFIQARAYSLVGDAYMELDEVGSAVSYYKKASNYRPNRSFTPTYLMKLGLAYETLGQWSDAADAYGRIVKEFPTANEIQDAKKYKARAETEARNS